MNGSSVQPHWDAIPVALAEGGTKTRQLLRAVTSAAARHHVCTGMTVPEARSRCAALDVLAWDDAVIARELARATAAFLSASPQVSPVERAPGTWWIGAGGFENIGGERALALALHEIARVWHPLARVGVADSCVAARATTWAVSREECGVRSAATAAPRIIPPGGCAAYLARAPLTLIPMDEELRETLTALGLRTAGAFAALDATEVERRWGADGLASWRLANGDDARRPVLARTDAVRFVSTEFAMSAATMEPVLFIVRAALGQLVDALVKDSHAAAAIAITLTLDDERGALPLAQPHTVTREVRPASPLARVAPLFERCRALLDQWTLTAPVAAVTVTVSATAPLGAEQGDLLAASWRDPAAADAAFERLRSTLGTGSVVRPMERDEHRPDKAGAWAELHDAPHPNPYPITEPQHPAPAPLTQDQPCTPSRLLETPERVEIEAPRNTPRTMWWRGRRISITRVVGPERLSGDWWKTPYARDYWRCESDELACDFLLYRDATGWRLQGWCD
jgi:protein ImuB